MIITRTPYRVSFLGGGSDYKPYLAKFGGSVLTSTIDRYCYISTRYMPAFLGSKYRVFYSRSEAVDKIEDIQHPAVRACLQYLEIEDGIEINHAGDLPARSGLGSSSAFVVGLLSGLYCLRGIRPSRATLASEAIQVEQECLNESVGLQDQVECAWGGLNILGFGRDGRYSVEPVPLPQTTLRAFEDHLVLVHTGLQRYASEIAQHQVANMEATHEQVSRLVELVRPGVDALLAGDFKLFGDLLSIGWEIKRKLSDKISNTVLDEIYAKACRHGAYGGKLLGAGGGGFFLFVVPPEKQQAMLDALGLLHVGVRFEHQGSQVVLAE